VGTFNIVAFGPPGSGKTVYLGALHHVLGGRSLGRGMSFTTDLATGRRLQRIYSLATNPENEEWPPSTNTSEPPREAKFTCRIEWTQALRWSGRTRLHGFSIFDITYIDYAGDWITEADAVDADLFGQFRERINGAHALLGIVDGIRLRRYLENDRGGLEFFQKQLRPVVEAMRGEPKPMHFIVTKWDVLSGYSLQEIAAVLLSATDTGFYNLVQTRTARRRNGGADVGEVRLIPVSAVGDFASLEPDWRVSKAKGRDPSHLNVEVPLLAAMLDVCDLALAMELQKAERSGGQARHWGRLRSGADDSEKGTVTIGPFGVTMNLRYVIGFALEAGFGAATLLGKPGGALGRRMRRIYRRVRATEIDGVRSEEAALLYAARIFRERLREFDADSAHHGSRLIASTEADVLPQR
jgi:hypothetical protein